MFGLIITKETNIEWKENTANTISNQSWLFIDGFTIQGEKEKSRKMYDLLLSCQQICQKEGKEIFVRTERIFFYMDYYSKRRQLETIKSPFVLKNFDFLVQHPHFKQCGENTEEYCFFFEEEQPNGNLELISILVPKSYQKTIGYDYSFIKKGDAEVDVEVLLLLSTPEWFQSLHKKVNKTFQKMQRVRKLFNADTF